VDESANLFRGSQCVLQVVDFLQLHLPLGDIQQMSEYFRRVVIKFFLKKELINAHLATSLINWKHSGFSVDNSVKIPATSQNARVNLSQYIVRHLVSLKKIFYVKENSTVIYRIKYDAYWGENIKLFKAADFIAELTMHIPPKHKHLIRYYGLYSSRTKGNSVKDGSLAKFGYKATPIKKSSQDPEMESVSSKASKRSWARLIQKVYEVDPWSLRSKLLGSFGKCQNYTWYAQNAAMKCE
jgi:hypothetical protein